MISQQAHRLPVDLSFSLVTALVQEAPQAINAVMADLLAEVNDPLGLIAAVVALGATASQLVGTLAEAIGVSPQDVWATLAPGCSTALDDAPWPWVTR